MRWGVAGVDAREYEPLGQGVDCVFGFSGAGFRNAERFSDPGADAVDSGIVRVQELGAEERRAAFGWRGRIAVGRG